MECPRLVVIGASAGGLEAVRTVLSTLRPDFPAAIVVVIHTSPDGTSALASVLGRSTVLPVTIARDGEPIRPRHVYVPPRDCHILVDHDRIALSRGPRQHGFRPAVDPLFVSAATSCRASVIGVVLSGGLGDGTLGLMAIKRSGGTAVVQNPEEAAVPSMPLTALRTVEVDHVLAAKDIAARLVEIANRPRPVVNARPAAGSAPRPALPGSIEEGTGPVHLPKGQLTPFTCPSCGGALWEDRQAGLARFACHVGHEFSPEALQALETDQLDRALWSAVRALQEDALLRKRMAAHAEERGMDTLAAQWHAQAEAAEGNARELRRVAEAIPAPTPADAVPERQPPAKRERRPRTRRG